MKKIKLYLFESLIVAVLPFSLFLLFAMFFLLLFVCTGAGFNIALKLFFVSMAVLGMGVTMCFIVAHYSRFCLYLKEERFEIQNRNKKTSYKYEDVESAEYFVIKWYMLPLFFLYKSGRGGQLHFKFKNGQRIVISVLYNDYIRIKSCLLGIEVEEK